MERHSLDVGDECGKKPLVVEEIKMDRADHSRSVAVSSAGL